MELVSVVIPTYNRAGVIKRSVESVLSQNYDNLEIIIIDDNSGDNTEEIVKAIGDERIKYKKSSKNRGAAFSRNVGIRMAKGKYIAFQDSDDEWMENKLHKQMELMRDFDYGMVYSMYSRDFGDGNLAYVPEKQIPMEHKRGDIYPFLLEQSFIGTPTMLVKSEVLKGIGGFETSLRNYEDYELALRIAKEYKIGYVDEVLTKAYTMGGSIDFNPIYAVGSSCYIMKKYMEDLKKYNLYETKRNVLVNYAKECGILEVCQQLLQEYSI